MENGERHHENLFIAFSPVYWLAKRPNIDKRLNTCSARVVRRELTRDEALKRIGKPKHTSQELEELKSYFLKKLDLTEEEFERRKGQWLPSEADKVYIKNLMQPALEVGKMANWIAIPDRGIKGLPWDYEYIRKV